MQLLQPPTKRCGGGGSGGEGGGGEAFRRGCLPACLGVTEKVGLLVWFGLVWFGLGWVGLVWIGLGWGGGCGGVVVGCGGADG